MDYCGDKYLPPARRERRAFFQALEPGSRVHVLPSSADEGSVVKKGVIVASPVHPNTWFSVKVGTRIIKVRPSSIAPVPKEDEESHLQSQVLNKHPMPMPRQPNFSPLRPADHPTEPAMMMMGGGGQVNAAFFSCNQQGQVDRNHRRAHPTQLTHVC